MLTLRAGIGASRDEISAKNGEPSKHDALFSGQPSNRTFFCAKWLAPMREPSASGLTAPEPDV
jgi:hypothetical protein